MNLVLQVLQFDCTNTLNDQLLEDVSIQLELPEGFELVATVPCERLEYNIKVVIRSHAVWLMWT